MENIYPMLIAFFMIFVSELGDKTQILVMSFSGKQKIATILLGVALGTFFSHGLAILFGLVVTWLGFVPYFMSISDIPAGVAIGEVATSIWSSKIRFMGAGTIGIAAIWTLITLLKPILDGIKMSIKAVSDNSVSNDNLHRMDTDMTPKSIGIVFVLIIIGLIGVFYSFLAGGNLSTGMTLLYIVVGIIVAVGMGFFVAAACGYMAGLIGTSSSPISGIGILGIIVSSLVVLALGNLAGLFSSEYGTLFATAFAIFITSVITSIAAISNDNLQDLKTGLLVGATPWKPQTFSIKETPLPFTVFARIIVGLSLHSLALSRAERISSKLCPSILITFQPKASHFLSNGSTPIISVTFPSICRLLLSRKAQRLSSL